MSHHYHPESNKESVYMGKFLITIALLVLLIGCGKTEVCKYCKNDGIIGNDCRTCGGEGRVEVKKGVFTSVTEVCPTCKGKTNWYACTKCGRGKWYSK